MISAELTFDHQHGPIVTVHCAGRRVSVYLMHETGVITDDADATGYGIEVKGDWWKLRQMFELPIVSRGATQMLESQIKDIRKTGEIKELMDTVDTIRHQLCNNNWDGIRNGTHYRRLGEAIENAHHHLEDMRQLLDVLAELDERNK